MEMETHEITFRATGRTGICCKENTVIRRISKPVLPCLGHYTTKFWLQKNFLIKIHLRHKMTEILQLAEAIQFKGII